MLGGGGGQKKGQILRFRVRSQVRSQVRLHLTFQRQECLQCTSICVIVISALILVECATP